LPQVSSVAKLALQSNFFQRTAHVKSITDGFNEIKDAHFGLIGCRIGKPPHFQHVRVMKNLCSNPPTTDGEMLAGALIARIEQNWRAGRDEHETAPSRENWRFRKAGKMSPRNASAEVTFERDLAGLGGENWANQVPTSSGLLGPHADKRRAIDLVERTGEGEYELIELKIDSNTPLFAALEILEYGALYVFSRMEAKALGYESGFSALLEAQCIRLRVLAPRSFYEFNTNEGPSPYQLEWLKRTLQIATRHLAQQIGGGFQMDFGFDVFPDGFVWESRERSTDDYVLKMAAGRHPLSG
jgi:hypothetical protein